MLLDLARWRSVFRHLVLDDRWRDDARGEDRVRRSSRLYERPPLNLGPVRGEREQMVELQLADDVARAIAGLAKVEQLLEADQPAVASDQPRGVHAA